MKNEVLGYSLTNIMSKKSRSALTVVSIMIGIAAIFIFGSFGIGLYAYVNEVADAAGVDVFFVQVRGMGAPGIDDTFALEEKDLEAVGKASGVEQATYFYMKPAQVEQKDTKKYVFLSGHSDDPEDIDLMEKMMTVEVTVGRQFEKGDRGKVVLGYNYQLPDKIFPEPFEVGDKFTVNGEKFSIIGFYESVGNPQDDSNVYLLEDDMKAMFGEDISFAVIIGRADDPERMDSITENVERELRRARGLEKGKEDFSVYSFSEVLEQFTAVLGIIVGFIFLIVIISAVVSSINTANTMITSVLERIKEIGVMKAIGAQNNTIRNIFLLESGILGLASGIFGAGLGLLLSHIGGLILADLGWSFLAPRYHWALFAGCILLATVVGSVSGMIPAIYASRQRPVDALRYE